MEVMQEVHGYSICCNNTMDKYVKEIADKAISFIDLQNELELACEIFRITWEEAELVPNFRTKADVPYGKLSFAVKILRPDLFHIVLVELDKFFARCFDTKTTIQNDYIYIDIEVLIPNKMLNGDFYINKVLDRYKRNIRLIRFIKKLHRLLLNYTSNIMYPK